MRGTACGWPTRGSETWTRLSLDHAALPGGTFWGPANRGKSCRTGGGVRRCTKALTASLKIQKFSKIFRHTESLTYT